MAITLAGCATSGKEPLARQLPPAPGYVQPVEVDEPGEDDDARAVAARERAGRVAANRVIVKFKDWYQGVRAKVAGEADGRARH